MKRLKEFLISNQKGFSLIEISIAILIIGIILSFGIKGYKMIDKANLSSLVNQISQYQIGIKMFSDSEGRLPGITNDGFSEKLFWEELVKENYISAEVQNGHATTKVGGIISASCINGNIFLKIESLNGNGALTPKQAEQIDKTLDTGLPHTGKIRAAGDGCTNGDTYNKSCDRKCCSLEVEI